MSLVSLLMIDNTLGSDLGYTEFIVYGKHDIILSMQLHLKVYVTKSKKNIACLASISSALCGRVIYHTDI